MPTSHIHRFEQLVYILTSDKFFSAAVRASYRYIKRRPTLSHVVSSSMPYLPHNPRPASLASRWSLLELLNFHFISRSLARKELRHPLAEIPADSALRIGGDN